MPEQLGGCMVDLKEWRRQRFGTGDDDVALISLGEVASDAKLRHSYVGMLHDFYTKDVKKAADGTVTRGGDMAERFQGQDAWTPTRASDDFEGYVAAQDALAEPQPGRLRTHTSVMVNQSQKQVVGEAWIRTPDTPMPITQWGGHTHSLVRPSARGLGHGKAMLGLSMAKAHELGIDNVHVTVSNDNPASYRRFAAMVIDGRAKEVPGDPQSGRRHYTIPTAPYAAAMKPAAPKATPNPQR